LKAVAKEKEQIDRLVEAFLHRNPEERQEKSPRPGILQRSSGI
jgi:hypothetical protein